LLYNTNVNKVLNKIKNHFVPNKNNEHVPHVLKHRSLNLIMLLVIVLELSFLVQYFVVFNKTNFLALVLPDVLVTQTNEQRIENNTNTLTVNPLLEKAAELKALDMASRGYFAHNTPDGKTPWYFLDQVDYNYKYAGENLAVNFNESSDVTLAWMNSPGHRANIVKKEYTEIGIATAKGIYEGHEAIFVVQFFGTPSTNNTNTQKVISNINTENTNSNNVLGEEVKTTPKTVTKKPTTNLAKEVKKVALNKTETTSEIKEVSPTLTKEPKTVSNEVLAISSLSKKVAKFNLINFIKEFATNPNNTVSTLLFAILGLFLIIFMIYLVKTEIMHPFVIVKSSALIFLIFMLLFMNIKVWHYDTKIPDNASSFISIAL
jgi:hypothetical protein